MNSVATGLESPLLSEIIDVIYREKAASEDALYKHLHRCDSDFIPPLHTKVDIQEYAKKIYGNSTTFEAWVHDDLVGLVAVYLNERSRKSGYITNVSVLKSYAGKGIGSALMEMCLKKSIQEKFESLMLEVNKDDHRALEMYRHFGFREFDRKGDSVLMKATIAVNKEK